MTFLYLSEGVRASWQQLYMSEADSMLPAANSVFPNESLVDCVMSKLMESLLCMPL